jgi:hypothetical protein
MYTQCGRNMDTPKKYENQTVRLSKIAQHLTLCLWTFIET